MDETTTRTTPNESINPLSVTDDILQSAAVGTSSESVDVPSSPSVNVNAFADVMLPQTTDEQCASVSKFTESADVPSSPSDVNSSADTILSQPIDQQGGDVLESFAPFPRLPIEIRLTIFELLPRPREITIRENYTPNPHPQGRTYTRLNYKSIVVKAKPEYTPVLLHVNREARLLMLKSYRVSFEVEALRPVYINSQLDVVTGNFRWLSLPWGRALGESASSFGVADIFGTYSMKITSDIHSHYDHDADYIGGTPETMLNLGSLYLTSVTNAHGKLTRTFVFVHKEWDAVFAKLDASDFYEYLRTKDKERLELHARIYGHKWQLEDMPVVVHQSLEEYEKRWK